MAFRKFAFFKAKANARVSLSGWDKHKFSVTNVKSTIDPRKIAGLEKFDPKDYLLSHVTIIASVDTEAAPHDYLITPATAKFVNDNHDAWTRGTLLKTFKTFIGAYNGIEHIQIFPEMARGRIIDAVARDVGESIYVDILIATEKRYGDLCAKIASGELTGASMGCIAEYTICSKCGNKAADDVELCSCILYEKGNTFIDEGGTQRVIAELCGHESDPESVRFVEASWVRTPAFKGAVRNKFISDPTEFLKGPKVATSLLESQMVDAPREPKAKVASKAQVSVVAKSGGKPLLFLTKEQLLLIKPKAKIEKAADGSFFHVSDDQAPAPMDNEEEEDEQSVEVKEELGLDELADDQEEQQVEEEIEDQKITPHEEQEWESLEEENPDFILDEDHLEESIVKSKQVAVALGMTAIPMTKIVNALKTVHKEGWSALGDQLTGRELLLTAAAYDKYQKARRQLEPKLYAMIYRTGGLHRYGTEADFVRVISQKLGQSLDSKTRNSLVSKARIYSLGGAG